MCIVISTIPSFLFSPFHTHPLILILLFSPLPHCSFSSISSSILILIPSSFLLLLPCPSIFFILIFLLCLIILLIPLLLLLLLFFRSPHLNTVFKMACKNSRLVCDSVLRVCCQRHAQLDHSRASSQCSFCWNMSEEASGFMMGGYLAA